MPLQMIPQSCCVLIKEPCVRSVKRTEMPLKLASSLEQYNYLPPQPPPNRAPSFSFKSMGHIQYFLKIRPSPE